MCKRHAVGLHTVMAGEHPLGKSFPNLEQCALNLAGLDSGSEQLLSSIIPLPP